MMKVYGYRRELVYVQIVHWGFAVFLLSLFFNAALGPYSEFTSVIGVLVVSIFQILYVWFYRIEVSDSGITWYLYCRYRHILWNEIESIDFQYKKHLIPILKLVYLKDGKRKKLSLNLRIENRWDLIREIFTHKNLSVPEEVESKIQSKPKFIKPWISWIFSGIYLIIGIGMVIVYWLAMPYGPSFDKYLYLLPFWILGVLGIMVQGRLINREYNIEKYIFPQFLFSFCYISFFGFFIMIIISNEIWFIVSVSIMISVIFSFALIPILKDNWFLKRQGLYSAIVIFLVFFSMPFLLISRPQYHYIQTIKGVKYSGDIYGTPQGEILFKAEFTRNEQTLNYIAKDNPNLNPFIIKEGLGTPEYMTDPIWSPDGNHFLMGIYFNKIESSKYRVYIGDLSRMTLEKLNTYTPTNRNREIIAYFRKSWQPWNADGKSFLSLQREFTTNQSDTTFQIFCNTLNGDSTQLIYQSRDNIYPLFWKKDSTILYLTTTILKDRKNQNKRYYSLWRLSQTKTPVADKSNLSGWKSEKLYSAKLPWWYCRFSPLGNYLVYSLDTAPNKEDYTCVLSTTDLEEIQLPEIRSNMGWSDIEFNNDGTKVFYQVTHPKKSDIIEYNLESRTYIKIISEKGEIRNLKYSPVGDRLAYSVDPGSLSSALISIRTDGSDRRRVLPSTHGSDFIFSLLDTNYTWCLNQDSLFFQITTFPKNNRFDVKIYSATFN